MAKDRVHRSYTAPGGHKPYQDQKAGQRSESKPAAQDQTTVMQYQAVEYLRRTIGGQWCYNSREKVFEARFDTRIADAIATYLQTQLVLCKLETAGAGGETRMSLTISQFSTLREHIRPKSGERTLALQYADAIAMSRRLNR